MSTQQIGRLLTSNNSVSMAYIEWLPQFELCGSYVALTLQSIQESQKLRLEYEMDVSDHRPLYPIDTGPKVKKP